MVHRKFHMSCAKDEFDTAIKQYTTNRFHAWCSYNAIMLILLILRNLKVWRWNSFQCHDVQIKFNEKSWHTSYHTFILPYEIRGLSTTSHLSIFQFNSAEASCSILMKLQWYCVWKSFNWHYPLLQSSYRMEKWSHPQLLSHSSLILTVYWSFIPPFLTKPLLRLQVCIICIYTN
jgi:hypothetical protein